MANYTYEVHTSLDPKDLTELAFQTYLKWVAFALGVEEVNGKRLKHPTGKYAESINMEKRGNNTIAIISTGKMADIIEGGAPAFSLKDKMLAKDSKTAKDGSKYRYIPGGMMDGQGGRFGMGQNTLTRSEGRSYLGVVAKGGNFTIPHLYAKAQEKGNVMTMSSKAGASAWNIPAFPAYSPAKHYANLARQEAARNGR